MFGPQTDNIFNTSVTILYSCNKKLDLYYFRVQIVIMCRLNKAYNKITNKTDLLMWVCHTYPQCGVALRKKPC